MSKEPKDFLEGKKDNEPMKIILKKDALQVHSRSTPAYAGHSQATMDWRKSISDMMNEHGLEFEVDTDYLFDNSFNVTIEGKGCISIPENMVDKVINDKREPKPKKRNRLGR